MYILAYEKDIGTQSTLITKVFKELQWGEKYKNGAVFPIVTELGTEPNRLIGLRHLFIVTL